ncbi:hypothetical protein CE91St41_35940 [Oscillospiraceae bacterium]|nr:hypothetical protein CE91St40_35930 [Oscillospiraceae bacterium]BDF76705.1 hypothetical protein CE91St41_35940 [Oscillospiraceae bacterium]
MAQCELGLVDIFLGLTGVDAVKQLTFFHPVSLFKGALQHLSCDQGRYLKLLNGGQGAGACEEPGEILATGGGSLHRFCCWGPPSGKIQIPGGATAKERCGKQQRHAPQPPLFSRGRQGNFRCSGAFSQFHIIYTFPYGT